MINLAKSVKLTKRSIAVVYLLGGEVVKPHFYLAKRKLKGNKETERWDGYGGKWKPSDKADIYATAKRKLKEKSGGITTEKKDLLLCGRVKIFYPGNTSKKCDRDIFYFKTYHYKGESTETEKMGQAKLFSVYNSPYKEMRPADEIIIPMLMSDRIVKGEIHFGLDQKGNTVVSEKKLTSSLLRKIDGYVPL